MVVPNTWLTRDYAQPIRDLLRRWFDLVSFVEDGDASWFEGTSSGPIWWSQKTSQTATRQTSTVSMVTYASG